jgi:tetrahydromethanopterin S-methyltransferase subunit B
MNTHKLRKSLKQDNESCRLNDQSLVFYLEKTIKKVEKLEQRIEELEYANDPAYPIQND